MMCNHGHNPTALDFGGFPCNAEAEPGRKKCRKHLDLQASRWREGQAKRKTRALARPEWMSNPALLPKRPPGQNPSEEEQ